MSECFIKWNVGIVGSVHLIESYLIFDYSDIENTKSDGSFFEIPGGQGKVLPFTYLVRNLTALSRSYQCTLGICPGTNPSNATVVVKIINLPFANVSTTWCFRQPVTVLSAGIIFLSVLFENILCRNFLLFKFRQNWYLNFEGKVTLKSKMQLLKCNRSLCLYQSLLGWNWVWVSSMKTKSIFFWNGQYIVKSLKHVSFSHSYLYMRER